MTKTLLEYIQEAELNSTSDNVEAGDDFVLELAEDAALETYVIESWDDSILLASDKDALDLLESYGCTFEDKQGMTESSTPNVDKFFQRVAQSGDYDMLYDAQMGKYGKDIERAVQDMYDNVSINSRLHPDDNFEEIFDRMLDMIEDDYGRDESVDEAEYQGRNVPLGKPMAGDVKKSKVYVKKPNGKVVKVNFGDKNLSIKKHIPGRRKNFRARHNCDNPGPRWKARYWSCRAW